MTQDNKRVLPSHEAPPSALHHTPLLDELDGNFQSSGVGRGREVNHGSELVDIHRQELLVILVFNRYWFGK